MLKLIMRVLAVTLLAVFVLVFPLSLTLRNVGSLLFDPETTKMFVRENVQGSDLISGLARQAALQMLAPADSELGEASAAQIALAQLDDEEWRQITRLIAPPRLIEDTTDQIVNAFAAWLNTQAAFPDVQVDIAGLRQNAIDNTDKVVNVVLSALPACDEQAVTELAAAVQQQDAEGFSAAIPDCLPPEPFYSQVVAQAELAVNQMLGDGPDVIDLSQLNQGEAPEELTQLKQNLVRVRTILSWSWLAVVGLGAVAVVMGASGLQSYLRWAGWPLLLSGMIALIFGVGLQVFSLNFIDQLMASAFARGTGAMATLSSGMAAGALDLVSRPLLLQGLFITALGTSSLIYARNLRLREASPGIPINRKKIGL